MFKTGEKSHLCQNDETCVKTGEKSHLCQNDETFSVAICTDL